MDNTTINMYLHTITYYVYSFLKRELKRRLEIRLLLVVLERDISINVSNTSNVQVEIHHMCTLGTTSTYTYYINSIRNLHTLMHPYIHMYLPSV